MLPVGKEDINQVNETNKGRDIPMLQTDRNTCKCNAVINFLVSGLALWIGSDNSTPLPVQLALAQKDCKACDRDYKDSHFLKALNVTDNTNLC